jgi:ketosteroid isomerase-like protein
MASVEEEVRAAAERFYTAIEAMVAGKGLGPIQEAWHHTDRVTSGHPSGDWAQGWDEVYATWEVFASFGHPSRAGTKIRSLKVHLCGEDVAYTTCVFTASPAFGGEDLACTNVLRRQDGAWKIVHHHADKAPKMGAALEKIAIENQ